MSKEKSRIRLVDESNDRVFRIGATEEKKAPAKKAPAKKASAKKAPATNKPNPAPAVTGGDQS